MSGRTEFDSLGEVFLPEGALYGASTARGLQNFPGMGAPLSAYPHFMRAMALTKRAAAMANRDIGALEADVADSVIAACDEIASGGHTDAFPTAIMEGSGGTSTNMNFNEVIANLADQILGGASSGYARIHPNDHVNCSQSTNDAMPTAIKLACFLAIAPLSREIDTLVSSLRAKAQEFQDMLRVGRTCMQAAQPMTWGQYFSGHASAVASAQGGVTKAAGAMQVVPMGGTAIGTGLGATKGYRAAIAPALSEAFGMDITLADDPFEAMHSTDTFTRMSAELRNLAATMAKLAGDLVILGSDGAAGIGELRLPAVQPGSSIMAGKVNPVMPMMVQQAWMRVHGHDATIALAAQSSQMEINHFEPLIALSLFEQIDTLTALAGSFANKCIAGIAVDEVRSYDNLVRSFGVSSVFLKELGYARVAALTKRSLSEGRPLTEIAVEEGLLSVDEIRRVLTLAATSSA